MYFTGVILAFIITFAKVFDTIINKKIMIDINPKQHSLYRIIFVSPILLIVALLNWRITSDVIPLLIFYSLFEGFNILFHQMSLNKLEPEFVDLISKSKIITVLFLSVALTIEKVGYMEIAGTLLFLFGIVLMADIKYRKKNKGDFNNQRLKGIVFQTISVFCRTAKPFILKVILLNKYASNEVVVFLSMPISFIVIYMLYKPKLDIRNLKINMYFIQAILVATSMLLMGYAILYSDILTVSVIESFSAVFLALVYMIMNKKLIKRNKLLGIIIGTIGLILVIIFN